MINVNASNITVTSNIYPIKGNMSVDRAFLSKVEGGLALKIVDKSTDYRAYRDFSDIQRMQLETVVKCTYNKEGDFTWGVRKREDNSLEWTCRCINRSCRYFQKCRPDFDEAELECLKDNYTPYEAYGYDELQESMKYEVDPIIYMDGEEVIYSDAVNLNSENGHNGVAINETEVVEGIFGYDTTGEEPAKADDIVIHAAPQYVEGERGNTVIEKGKKDGFLSDDDIADVFRELGLEQSQTDKMRKALHSPEAGSVDTGVSGDKEPDEDEYEYYKEPQSVESLIVEQEYIIQADLDEKLLVNAGPGTGKTYSLIERLKYLVREYDLVPQDDILVLCFSRAAISEIKNRIKGAIEKGEADFSLGNVEIRTFDSFATYLLGQLDEKLDLSGCDYDQRIQMAVDAIKRNSGLFDNMKHFIVDEIQDLVGIRAKLVQAVLKAARRGFTLLGDSCQSIYDYQISDGVKDIDSVRFYNWLNNYFGASLTRVELASNRRQDKELASLTERVRHGILHEDDSAGKLKLGGILQASRRIGEGSAHKISRSDLERYGSVCFLCRSNGEALKLSSLLRNNDVEHVVQRLSGFTPLDSWLGMVFGEWEEEVVDQDDFRERLQTGCGIKDAGDARAKWDMLKGIERGSSSRLVIRDLLDSIYNDRNACNDLYTAPQADVVVSTIHKAKGREYDEVVLLEETMQKFINDEKCDGNTINEIKTYYVAITRPKRNILKTGFNRGKLRKLYGFDERWYETGYNSWKNKLANIEIGREADMDKTSFVNLKLFGKPENVLLNQEYIRSEVKPGDQVVLRREPDDLEFNGLRYDIYHSGKAGEVRIGSMSSLFTDSVKRILNACSRSKNKYLRPEDFPDEIDKVYVEQMVSYIYKDKRPGIDDIHKRTEIWNGVALVGFGHVHNEFDW